MSPLVDTGLYGRLEPAVRDAGGAGPPPAAVLGPLARVLEGIAAGRDGPAGVLHPLGFTCLPVYRQGPLGVCVHLWRPAAPAPAATTSAMHAHSWQLVSLVLFGEIRNEIFDVLDGAADAATHRVFAVVSRDGVDELQPTDRLVRPVGRAVHGYPAGARYTLDAGVFHTSSVPDGLSTATVVLGRELPGRADLSLGGRHLPGHRIRRRLLDPDATARTARLVLDRLPAADRSTEE